MAKKSLGSAPISDDGKATEVVFPSIDNDAWLKEGTFPNLAECPGTRKTPELVSCLQPNRRVDIEVSGEQ